MSFRLFAIFFLVITLILSCDKKDTTFTKKINNTSNKTISFYFFGLYNPITYGDTVTVAPGEIKEINSYTEDNSNVSIQQPCRIVDDSVGVEISGGGILQKDMRTEGDWSYSTDMSNNQICTFEISDSDIL